MNITVFTHPNAKRPRIEVKNEQTLHVYVSARPIEGKANKAVIEALSQHFKVKENQISLLHGAKSKVKTFAIDKV